MIFQDIKVCFQYDQRQFKCRQFTISHMAFGLSYIAVYIDYSESFMVFYFFTSPPVQNISGIDVHGALGFEAENSLVN